MIGYDVYFKAYCIYLPTLKKIIISKEIIFNEIKFYNLDNTKSILNYIFFKIKQSLYSIV